MPAVQAYACQLLVDTHDANCAACRRRIDDIKYQAEKFGIVRDVYLPKGVLPLPPNLGLRP